MSKTIDLRIFEGPRRNKHFPSWRMAGEQKDICLKLGVEKDDLDKILNIKKRRR